METMSTALAFPDYATALSEIQPAVIQNEEQHQQALRTLEKLIDAKSESDVIDKLVSLLTLLVEEYEQRNYPMPEAGPLDIIRHLMEEHGLRQKDLVDVFGTESIVSDVLNGKRELTKDHIKRLSARFAVSPAVFF
jgi:HTH-type transcriptional regulator/antitoxin HigA